MGNKQSLMITTVAPYMVSLVGTTSTRLVDSRTATAAVSLQGVTSLHVGPNVTVRIFNQANQQVGLVSAGPTTVAVQSGWMKATLTAQTSQSIAVEHFTGSEAPAGHSHLLILAVFAVLAFVVWRHTRHAGSGMQRHFF